jgi:hypothetical protein
MTRTPHPLSANSDPGPAASTPDSPSTRNHPDSDPHLRAATQLMRILQPSDHRRLIRDVAHLTLQPRLSGHRPCGGILLKSPPRQTFIDGISLILSWIQECKARVLLSLSSLLLEMKITPTHQSLIPRLRHRRYRESYELGRYVNT